MVSFSRSKAADTSFSQRSICSTSGVFELLTPVRSEAATGKMSEGDPSCGLRAGRLWRFSQDSLVFRSELSDVYVTSTLSCSRASLLSEDDTSAPNFCIRAFSLALSLSLARRRPSGDICTRGGVVDVLSRDDAEAIDTDRENDAS